MPINLSGPQLRQLYDALLDAFPGPAELGRMVLFELDANLATVAGNGKMSEITFELLKWAKTENKLEQLILGAHNSNPNSALLNAIVDQMSSFERIDSGPEQRPRSGFAKWHPLFQDLQNEQCTPIVGPALLEPLLGSPREMARLWARRHGFPAGVHSQDDLPQVAQFLDIVEGGHLVAEFYKYVTTQLLERHGHAIPPESAGAPHDELFRLAAQARWAAEPTDPYRVLAELPCPIYITSNPDNLLAQALLAAGKAPEVELCRWHEDGRWPASVYGREPGYQPSVARPLVFHLFGRLPHPFSLVLKEEDYLDYLTGVARRMHLVPAAVRAALADSSLLFLGFGMTDWSFRVLFHSLMSQEAPGRRSLHAHVAVQLDPEEGAGSDLERARYYLEKYFAAADVTVYWGRAERFLLELKTNWTRYSSMRVPAL